MSTSELIKFDGEMLTFNDGKITSVTLTEEGGVQLTLQAIRISMD